MKKIGIIGTGISAMAAGYFLKEAYDITFFEKNDYAGGHTNTLMVDDEGELIPIDSAFMVYNEVTYPHLTRLFQELDVETKNTNMSFSVQHLPSGLEYCGTGLNGLFSQRRTLFSPRHVKMLMEINRFNQHSLEVLEDPKYTDYSLEQYVKENNYGDDMVYKYLIPMSSAVWSTPIDLMLDFPVVTLVRFFKNHGFLGLRTQHQWRTVVGGSESYKDKILQHFKDKIYLNCGIKKVQRQDQGVLIEDMAGKEYSFDKVICASHADQTLEMLADATSKEQDLLSRFKYQPNKATLHTDVSVMPKTKRAWSAWNYRIARDKNGRLLPSTIYHMNKLQGVSEKNDYFISINETGEVDRAKVIWEKDYTHPLFSVEANKVQDQLPELNEDGPVYYCGAYFRYGFHEDGFVSGKNVAEKILDRKVWA